jgi:hypothetical protein
MVNLIIIIISLLFYFYGTWMIWLSLYPLGRVDEEEDDLVWVIDI